MVAAIAVVASACTSGSQAQVSTPDITTTQTVVTTVGTHTGAPTTVFETVTATNAPTRTVTAQPPPSTHEPAAQPGDCPYLPTGTVAAITGQRESQPTIVDVKPFPICQFYRTDGRWSAVVRIIQAKTPEAATAAVNQHVPIADSQPASQPEGWIGGSIATGQQIADGDAKSTYAVAKGTWAIVVEEDESPSIKARQIAVCSLINAGLHQAALPDYCAPVG